MVVDASRRLVFDNAEKFTIRVSEALLRSCGSPEAAKRQVAGVRRIIIQGASTYSSNVSQ